MPKTISSTFTKALGYKHSIPKPLRAEYVETLRELIVVVQAKFRHDQMHGTFTDRTGDKFIAHCVATLSEPVGLDDGAEGDNVLKALSNTASYVEVESLDPKPNATIEERQWVLATQDAAYLDDCTTREIAEFLTSFSGYPNDEESLSQCERETLIECVEGEAGEDDMYRPYFSESGQLFATEDEAYASFCEHYVELRRRLTNM